jgi:hypothetical protein
MADSPFELNIDSDWKKQAQEEKRKLAEEAKQREAPPPAPTPARPAPSPAPGRRAPRELPPASFPALVESLARQARLYLGGVAVSEGQGIVDLDTAKHHLDLLAVLEAKTAGNLDPDDQAALDIALYETHTRFASVASRYIL